MFAIVQGGLVGPIVHRFGERRALITGLLCGAAGFLIYGMAPTGWWFVAGVPIMSIWGLYGPSAQGLMSRRVSAGHQGQLQGALSSVMGLTGIIGPGLFTSTFAYFISPARAAPLPGAPFLVATALLVTGVGLAWKVTKPA